MSRTTRSASSLLIRPRYLTFLCLILLLAGTVRPQTGTDISYVYDELGRLVAVIDAAGETAIYTYDAVGNLLSISRRSSAQVSIIEFTPNGGPVGATVTIYGTGFSATPGQSTVTFNGTAAVVSSATATKLVTSVPAGATTGLISITTPTGSATSSTPFVVGNSGAPTITGFTPTIGVTGTAISVTGTNFETAAANNRVKLNVTNSAVNSATATTISTSVPSGATSGRISVSTPSGSTVSSADFFVPPPPYTAADVVATDRMVYGESRTVTLGAANKIGLIVFDGTAGQRASLRVTSSTIAGSRVTIYNPSGTTLAASSFNTSGGLMDTPTLPTTGTYTILIDPDSTHTGGLTFTLYNATDFTGTITPGGSAVMVTTTTPGQNAKLTFNGTAGQRVSLKMEGVTIGTSSCCSSRVSIYKPDGAALIAPSYVGTSGGFFDTQVLPANGTYTILVDPEGANTGGMTLTLIDVPQDIASTITAGGPSVTITTTTPGQNATLGFSGTAGQRISLRMTGVTIGTSSCCSSRVSILNPDGTTLVAPSYVGTSGGFFDTQTLSASGTYTILVNPEGANIGSMTLTLINVLQDVANTITPGGSPVTVTTTTPGQNAKLTFSGSAGQRVSLKMSGVTIGTSSCCSSRVSVLNPDGTALIAPSYVGTSGGFFDTKTLLAAGTYTIFVDPENSGTGSMTLTLYDVPADINSSIVPSAQPVTVSTTVPGQNALLTFNGVTGQRISLRMTGVTIGTSSCCSSRVSILNPDGTTLVAPSYVGTSGGFFDTQTLSASGTYTILVNPEGANIGSMTLTLYDVPADVNSTATIGGPAAGITISVPGQNADLTFGGTAGQQVTVRVTNSTMGTVTVTLLKPDGASLTTYTSYGGANFNLATQTLPVTGTYTIRVNPSGANTGSMNVSLTNP